MSKARLLFIENRLVGITFILKVGKESLLEAENVLQLLRSWVSYSYSGERVFAHRGYHEGKLGEVTSQS